MSDKQGFVYIWRDRKHNRYYVGCHWGRPDDRYVCSSVWMKKAYVRRPEDFRRRFLARGLPSKQAMFEEEYKYLQMIKPHEAGKRYYNLHLAHKNHWSARPDARSVAQRSGEKRRGIKITHPDPVARAANIKAAKLAKNPGPPKEVLLEAIASTPAGGVMRLAKQFDVSHRLMSRWLESHSIVVPEYQKPKKPKRVGSTASERWANPEWADTMRARLRAGAARRQHKSPGG